MSSEACYYVYVYIDPRNHRPFYYGKGCNGRKESHLQNLNDLSKKSELIKTIRASGDEPVVRVIAANLTEEQAFFVEATLIWKDHHLLLNAVAGHYSEKFRPYDTLNQSLCEFDFGNEIHLINVGEGPHRTWEDNILHGFIGGGQGKQFADKICSVNKGDIIIAYLSGFGYVGVGRVLAEAQTISEFSIRKALTAKDFKAKHAFQNSSDIDLSEYCIPMEWLATKTKEEAVPRSKIGFHHIGLKASLSGRPQTLKNLESAFQIKFEELFDSNVSTTKLSA